jgi:hypothetical protein
VTTWSALHALTTPAGHMARKGFPVQAAGGHPMYICRQNLFSSRQMQPGCLYMYSASSCLQPATGIGRRCCDFLDRSVLVSPWTTGVTREKSLFEVLAATRWEKLDGVMLACHPVLSAHTMRIHNLPQAPFC